MLPDGNGLELLRRVREWGMDTRVVVATGAYDWQLLEQVKALRPHFVLLKPLNWDIVCRWLPLAREAGSARCPSRTFQRATLC